MRLRGEVFMAKVTIEIPDDVVDLASHLERVASELSAAMPKVDAGATVDTAAFGRAVEASVAGLEREMARRFLQGLDIDARHVFIGGKRHARVGRHQASYKTKAGEVRVTRSIYRQAGVRNGKTVDAVGLRAGVVADGWLPEAAAAMAFLIQQGTSREAEATARCLGRLPYSRSSFERVGHAVGASVVEQSAVVEEHLRGMFEIPAGAHSISVGVDRVSVAMEEPRAKPVGRPKAKAAKRPVTRAFRMAYVGTVCIHDKEGGALRTIRYGRMPAGDAQALCRSLQKDVGRVIQHHPALHLVTLADGAAEMQGLLATHISAEAVQKNPVVLVDFWHVIEKLGQAAEAIWDDKQARAASLRRWKTALLERSKASDAILTELLRTGMESKRVGDTMPVHDAITYLTNNAERMDYSGARAAGLPIGSGVTEATCKSLFDIRLKRPGARWKTTTGEHVVHMRALALSDRWHEAIEHTLRPLKVHVEMLN
jgi:hypothetical protein